MFVDRVTLRISAGKGGNGVVAWRREKYIPKGGPSGGNGGKGGDVILHATAQVSSLDQYRNLRTLKAENGIAGGSNRRTGRGGRDLTVRVPLGTLVKDVETGEILCDMTTNDQLFVLCKGGKGGRGNDSFKTPTNRAPNTCTLGAPGESHEIELELKIIADVGLVGFPNAGKSTLIQQLARVRVKVAAYPFTTLHPNLGHLTLKDGSRLVIADIPGIIEGAHLNRGLGIEFLRHVERTRLLLFMLDASGIDGRTPLDDFQVLQNEIREYNPDMLDRPRLVVLNKIDTDESAALIKQFKKKIKLDSKSLFEISAITGEGLPELVHAIERLASKKDE